MSPKINGILSFVVKKCSKVWTVSRVTFFCHPTIQIECIGNILEKHKGNTHVYEKTF